MPGFVIRGRPALALRRPGGVRAEKRLDLHREDILQLSKGVDDASVGVNPPDGLRRQAQVRAGDLADLDQQIRRTARSGALPLVGDERGLHAVFAPIISGVVGEHDAVVKLAESFDGGGLGLGPAGTGADEDGDAALLRHRRERVARQEPADRLHVRQRADGAVLRIMRDQVDVNGASAAVAQRQQRLARADAARPFVLGVLDERQLDGELDHVRHRLVIAVCQLRLVVPDAAARLRRRDGQHRKLPVEGLRQPGVVVARRRRAGAAEHDRLAGLGGHAARHVRRRPLVHAGEDLKERIRLHARSKRDVGHAGADDDPPDVIRLQQRQQDQQVFFIWVHKTNNSFSIGPSRISGVLKQVLLNGEYGENHKESVFRKNWSETKI